MVCSVIFKLLVHVLIPVNQYNTNFRNVRLVVVVVDNRWSN